MVDGIYKTDKGVTYEVRHGDILVEHENGYSGRLYGKTSMAAYQGGKEKFHTGSRNINTADELYVFLAGLPRFIEMMCNPFNDEDDDD